MTRILSRHMFNLLLLLSIMFLPFIHMWADCSEMYTKKHTRSFFCWFVSRFLSSLLKLNCRYYYGYYLSSLRRPRKRSYKALLLNLIKTHSLLFLSSFSFCVFDPKKKTWKASSFDGGVVEWRVGSWRGSFNDINMHVERLKVTAQKGLTIFDSLHTSNEEAPLTSPSRGPTLHLLWPSNFHW